MEEKNRNFYDKIRDAVSAYVLHDPNAQAATAFEREKKMKAVDEKTLAMFRESAEAGHPFSCFNLGRCYETGSGVEKDLEQAYEWYRKAATGGDVNAWLALAKMFDTGTYVDKDPKEAAMWLERAAAKDHPIAKIGMGQKYSRGDGVERDPALALKYFKEAQKLAPGIGSYILGEAIGDGIGCKKDYEEAAKYFRIAHENNFALGTFNLGMMLEMGLGCEKDEKRGFELIKQAADKDVPDAMYRIAFHYREGTSEAHQDDKKAFEYFKKAADMDFAPACVETGLSYENGVGTEVNKEEAFRYYKKGADRGLHTAIVCLAVCYRAGIGCEPDEDKALSLLEQAIKIGNTRAYHLMASYLLEENPYDERAIDLEMVAARSGFTRSALFLGGYFLQRGETEPDEEKAAHYFRLAAKEGDTTAKFELAELLDTEQNKKDEKIQKEIWQLYKESADAGHPLAAYKMAKAYRDGKQLAKLQKLFPGSFELEQEILHKEANRYISVAASGGIPAACHETADRCFWGDDGELVNIHAACGLYHYCADEIPNKSLMAWYAFCKIVVELEFVYGKIGEYDPVIYPVIESSRAKVVKESSDWKEAMDLLTSLAKERVPDAWIFLPLAKALSYGEFTDFSSEEDQEMLDYIDKLPDSRGKYYVRGLFHAITKPKEITQSIRILRYARTEYGAGNIDQILGNLYLSLSRCKGKIRKEEIKVLKNPANGWISAMQTDSLKQVRERIMAQKKGSLWSDPSIWTEKKPKHLELLDTSAALQKEALRTGQTRDTRSYNRCCEQIYEEKLIIVVLPLLILMNALICLLVTGFRAGWILEAGRGPEKFGFWDLALLYGESFVWGLLAIFVIFMAFILYYRISKIRRKVKQNKKEKKE